MGNDCCCCRRSGSPSIEALLKRVREQHTTKDSELSLLQGKRAELENGWLAERADGHGKAGFEEGELVIVMLGARTREGEIEAQVSDGRFRVRWSGANPKYAPPEEFGQEKLQSAGPPRAWIMERLATELNKIYQKEMQGIWDEFVGPDAEDAWAWPTHMLFIREYSCCIKAHIFEIWSALIGKQVSPTSLKRLKGKLQLELDRAMVDLQRNIEHVAKDIWQDLGGTGKDDEWITKDLFFEKYYIALNSAIPLRKICGDCTAQAVTQMRLSELLSQVPHLRGRYNW